MKKLMKVKGYINLIYNMLFVISQTALGFKIISSLKEKVTGYINFIELLTFQHLF